MGRFFNLDSPLMAFLSKMADLMILNILTLLLCLPIITAGDAMTALYYMTIKMVRGEDCYIVRGYFKSFKENFKQATLIWLMVLFVLLILIGDFWILRNVEISFGTVLTVMIMAIAVVFVFVLVYVFPVLSRFDNTIKHTLKNSLLMSIMNLPKTILLILINLLPVALLLLTAQAMPFLIMFGFSVPAYVCSMLFAKIFKRYEPEEEDAAGSDELETLSFIKEEEEEKQKRLREAGSLEEDAREEAAPEENGQEEENAQEEAPGQETDQEPNREQDSE